MKQRVLSINPFNLFLLIEIIVIVLYQLKWSQLYPNISLQMWIFMLITGVLMFVCGKFFSAGRLSMYILTTPYKSYDKKYTLFGLVFFLFGIYCVLKTKDNQNALPENALLELLYILFTIFSSYFCMFNFYGLMSEKIKKNKLKYIVNIILIFVVYLLLVTRSVLVVTLLNFGWIYLYKKIKVDKISFRKIFIGSVILLLVL